jgi:UPF0271 protein
MTTLDLNMDVGEGMNNEAQLFPYISSCNIACGGHAGTYESMHQVIKIAKTYGVKIGAHPSYPDKAHFGRRRMNITNEALRSSIEAQLKSFITAVAKNQVEIHHVKPHGALYNEAAKNTEIAKTVLMAIKSLLPVPIYAPFDSVIAQMAPKFGLEVIYEAFADRNYNDDLSLVSRSEPDALILQEDEMLAHVLEIVEFSRVKTRNGVFRPLRARTICLHSDSKDSGYLVKSLHKNLRAHGIKII